MKNKSTLLTIALLAAGLYNTASAQWVKTSLTNQIISDIKTDGSKSYASTYSAGVFSSSDNGATWVPAGLTGKGIYALAISGTDVYAASTTEGAYKTTDNGANWNTVNTGITELHLRSLAVFGNDIYAGTSASGSGGVFQSQNGGSSWTYRGAGATQYITYTSFAKVGNNVLVGSLSGVYKVPATGPLTDANNGITASYNSISAMATSGSTVYAGGPGGIFMSEDGGDNWTNISSGLAADTSISSIATNGTAVFVGTGGGKVWLSKDKGTTWTDVNTGLPALTISALSISGQNLLAGTYGIGIYQRPVSEMGVTLGVNEVAAQHVTVYPNPSENGIFHIAMTDAKPAVVKVFNMLGALVHNQAVASNESLVDLGHLPAGIYSLQVGQSTHKVCIQK